MKPKVYLYQNDQLWKSLEVASDQSLLHNLKQQGIELKSSCGGHASCADCVVKVMKGGENLSPIDFAESRLLGNIYHITRERLSCQSYLVAGELSLDITHQEKAYQGQLPAKKTQLLKKKQIEDQEQAQMNELEKSEVEQKKVLGGGRRPKSFQYNNNENDED